MLRILYKVSILGILPSLIVCFSGLLVYLILENALLWKKNMQWFGVGKECYNSKEGIN